MPSDRVSTPESSEPAKNPPRIFISYSHDSAEHVERVLELANRLRADGVDAWIDQYELAPAEGWPLWMEQQIEQADFVLCVCTETYRRRFESKEEAGKGLGVSWEGALVRTQLYLDQAKNSQFVPVLFDPIDAELIPKLLSPYSHFLRIADEGYDDLYRLLTGQPKTTAPPLGPLRRLDRRSFFGRSLVSDPAPDNESLNGYCEWAQKHYAHLDLIGIDAGDVQVKFEEVYVPLRVASRRSLDSEGLGMFRGGRCLEDSEHQPEEAIEIEDVLRRQGHRHVLIFGEPGSGKTTALLKLHQLCWQSADGLGLDPETVPVFLRLRHFDRKLLDQGLAAFVEHEVYQLSGSRQKGLGEKLWNHGRLLLLFDGLDEIADAEHREEVLRRIGWYLGQDGAESIRAVVSCRRVGLPSRDADRDGQFETYEVRPFDDEQIAQLVRLWFREVARRGKITEATADKRVSTILDALGDRSKSSQQILEMTSNPLLLTLLCVVVLLGNEIPKKRVRFYEQCLDVLLDRWPRQRGRLAPVELGSVQEALGHLAFYLHSAERRDDLTWAEALVELVDLLGDETGAEELFDWLHCDVGLLVDYTEEDFGFVHLGLQEHLAARHLISNPGELDFLEGDFDESWWTEVFLQISALSERAGFNALMTRLLEHCEALERQAGLLRSCLQETTTPDLGAFVRILDGKDPTRQQAVLRLLAGFSFRPAELMDALGRLQSGSNLEVSEAASLLFREGRSGRERRAEEGVAVIVGSAADAVLGERLAQHLRDHHGGFPAQVLEGLGRESGRLLKLYRAVFVLVGTETGDWRSAASLQRLYRKKLWMVIRLPGAGQIEIPEVFGDCKAVAWQLDEEATLIEDLASQLLAAERAADFSRGSRSRRVSTRGESLDGSEPEAAPYTDPVTGATFLPVPGGTFTMGDDELFSDEEKKRIHPDFLETSAPACRVQLSPFYLAKTPVTNAQYGRFLEASDRDEPGYWRDRRFSNSEQPVVGVSWDDAKAYCEWLSRTSPDGYQFSLPSEAQWEFAARGPESRRYPWGAEDPREQLACFGLDFQEGKPATVGSYVEGAGPFGHLDLAGLVWEWCRDAWETNHSRWLQEEPALDPVGVADPDLRPLRGGAWYGGAGSLRSAIRDGFRPERRVGLVGFRVLCAPPSLKR